MTPAELDAAIRGLGLSRSQAAAMLGVTTNTVARYASGARGVPGPVVRLLAIYSDGYRPDDWPERGRAGVMGRPPSA